MMGREDLKIVQNFVTSYMNDPKDNFKKVELIISGK